MFTSKTMNFINIIVLDKDKDKVVNAIIKSGIVHLANSDDINKFIKEERGVFHYKEILDINKLKAKVHESLEKFNIHIEEKDIKDVYNQAESMDIQVTLSQLDKILLEFDRMSIRMKNIAGETTRYKQMLEQIDILKTTGYKFTNASKYEFLDFRIGQIQPSQYEQLTKELEDLPVVTFPVKTSQGRLVIYVVSLKKNKMKVNEILNQYQFSDMQFTDEISEISDNIIDEIREKIKNLSKEKEELVNLIEKFKKEHSLFLKDVFFKTRVLELKNTVKNFFFKTSKSYIISGWIPVRTKNRLFSLLEKLVGKNYYVEILKTDEMEEAKDIPVAYSNPRLLRPFEDITYNYGIPEYKTLNPVPILAVTYLIMFGVMFGDLGHGLILFLTGIIFKGLKKLRSISSILSLISYCGLSSMIFGVLFGSIFGYENIIKPLWLRPIENINTLFMLAIGFGISLITIGIIINIINSFITKDFIKGIFSKSGLIGGILYWGLIIIVSKLFVQKQTPHKSLYFFFIWLPFFLLFLKEPIAKIIDRKKQMFKEGVGIYIMENLVEVLEIVIGYVSNTMSFIRVVAFGLAHAGLFIAVFSLVEILKKSGAPTFTFTLVLILGNIGIILLEGIIVSIQAMRLEYYEFFDKFFQKTGTRYKPVKI
ncbi:MAG: hypothetical protein JW827_02280 [Spirochaetes bacterium]|nr:hypothetical protein [Spirochaetota bacterium]